MWLKRGERREEGGKYTRSGPQPQEVVQASDYSISLISRARPFGFVMYADLNCLPPSFIYRLTEMLRKLVGTIRLLPLPCLLQKSQPSLPSLGNVVLCLVVIALTFRPHLLKPLPRLLTPSVCQQVALVIILLP